MGMMWTKVYSSHKKGNAKIRHECRQENNLKRYGWVQHDGQNFGHQEILDQKFNVQLNTTFVQLLDSSSSRNTSSWAVHVPVKPNKEKKTDKPMLDLFFYIEYGCYDDSLDHECRQRNGNWSMLKDNDFVSSSSVVEFTGQSNQIFNQSKFRIWGNNDNEENEISFTFWGKKNVNALNIQQSVETLIGSFENEHEDRVKTFRLDNSIEPGSALVLIHAQVPLNDHPDIFIQFQNQDPASSFDQFQVERKIKQDIQKYSTAFENRFDQRFPMHHKNKSEVDSTRRYIGQVALSSLVGGMSYFYGASLVESKSFMGDTLEPQENDMKSLYTAIPSRSFFPRGFLWDEGFHQLAIGRWDVQMTKEVLVSWFSHMDSSGWISREQILGAEARTRVPREFLVQSRDHANPPTLFLALELVLRQSTNADSTEPDLFFAHIFPKAMQLYHWFKTTQSSSSSSTNRTMRWRGRSPEDGKLIPNTLASGLDDYPRASQPSGEEMHLDLLCWMIKSAKILHQVGSHVKASTSILLSLEQDITQWTLALENVHWDATREMYFDLGLHSIDGTIDHEVVVKCQDPDTGATVDTTTRLDTLQSRRETKNPCPEAYSRYLYPYGDGQGGFMTKYVFHPGQTKLQFVPEVGYVSCFPLLLQILQPDSWRLRRILDTMVDPEELWSDFGLRSLSKSSVFYQVDNAPGDRAYWRGAVWINVNYLALTAFHAYAEQAGPWQTDFRVAYEALRENLIQTITQEYRRTGYFWEQYNQDHGNGQRCHPFTGWTALLVNILAEVY